MGVVRDKILTRIIKGIADFKTFFPAQAKPTAAEIEMAWVFHGGIFYYGVRRYIYEMPALQEKEEMIANAIDGLPRWVSADVGGCRMPSDPPRSPNPAGNAFAPLFADRWIASNVRTFSSIRHG